MDFEPWVDPPSEREQRHESECEDSRLMAMRRARGVRTFRPMWSTKNIEFVHQSPTKVQPGKSPAAPAAAKSEELRRSRSYYECARVFGVARPRPEGSAVALLQNVSNSFFP